MLAFLTRLKEKFFPKKVEDLMPHILDQDWLLKRLHVLSWARKGAKWDLRSSDKLGFNRGRLVITKFFEQYLILLHEKYETELGNLYEERRVCDIHSQFQKVDQAERKVDRIYPNYLGRVHN